MENYDVYDIDLGPCLDPYNLDLYPHNLMDLYLHLYKLYSRNHKKRIRMIMME